MREFTYRRTQKDIELGLQQIEYGQLQEGDMIHSNGIVQKIIKRTKRFTTILMNDQEFRLTNSKTTYIEI